MAAASDPCGQGEWDAARRALREAGIKARAVPVGRLAAIREWFAAEVEGDHLPSSVHERFAFSWGTAAALFPGDGRPARSIVVLARAAPFSRVAFVAAGRRLEVATPPTYGRYAQTAEDLLRALRRALGDRHVALPARLPAKSLAVFSGLARWGRNNITYVPGWGSYVYLASFVSDLELADDGWPGPSLLERCASCIACARACPTGAIDGDRVLLHTERCLTFLNEGDEPFPDWLDPAVHECPVGCAACQRACPENAGRERSGSCVEFDAAETELLLAGAAEADLTVDLRDRLLDCGLLDYLPQLPRNLGALLQPGL